MIEDYKKRRDLAAQKNCYTLFEALKKSTQEWQTKLTGIQHWQPEHGFDVYVFDPDNLGETYVLLRRWNEEKSKFDEQIKKHASGQSDAAVAGSETKVWVFEHWDELKSFTADSVIKEETQKEIEKEEPESEEEEKDDDDIVKNDESFDEAKEEAFEDVSEEKKTKFNNFLDNGVQTEEEREEMWKHPWIRRIANQLSEMGKDYSQFERVLQNSKERRDQALQKSIHVLNEKIQTIAQKVGKKNV